MTMRCSFGIDSFMDLVQTVADKLDSNDAQIIVDFPFFRIKKHHLLVLKACSITRQH